MVPWRDIRPRAVLLAVHCVADQGGVGWESATGIYREGVRRSGFVRMVERLVEFGYGHQHLGSSIFEKLILL